MKFAAVAVALVLLVASFSVRAVDGEDAFARVIVAETELCSGPGVSHRVIYRAHRGETFLIDTRETSGYWLQVELPDGRSAFVFGDTVEAVAVSEGAADA